jgi:hypothetical protein
MVSLSKTPATMTAKQNKFKTGEEKIVTADMKKKRTNGGKTREMVKEMKGSNNK